MNKKIQLVMLVVLSFCVVIFFWVYVNRNFNTSSSNDKASEFNDSLKNIEDIFDKGIDGYKEQKKVDQDKLIKAEIVQNVMNLLSSERKLVEYQNEIWGIKFNYDPEMTKENQENTILLNNTEQSIVIKRESSENSFNDWLNENFDLQELEKKNNNDNIFWYQDIKSDDFSHQREYYTQIGDDIYIISASSTEKGFLNWKEMEKTILSIQKYSVDAVGDVNK